MIKIAAKNKTGINTLKSVSLICFIIGLVLLFVILTTQI